MSDFEFGIGDANYSDDIDLSRQIRGLENDKIMTERSIKAQQDIWSSLLKGQLGQDIHDVLEGKTKVKLPLSERIKFTLNKWVNNILKFI